MNAKPTVFSGLTTSIASIALLPIMFAATSPALAQATQDPWLPPASRKAPLAAETRDAALQRQVLGKLEAQFRQADAAGRGAISLAEARRAGWGFAVQNFDQLDTQARGEIHIQDLQRFMQKRQQQATQPQR